MNITFDKKSHTYWIDGKETQGVTGAIDMFPKLWLPAWACKVMAEWLIEQLKHQKFIEVKLIKELILKAKNTWRTTRDTAGDFGQFTHEKISFHVDSILKIKHEIEPYPKEYEDKIEACYQQFLLFEKKYNPIWIASEQVVGNVLKDNDGDLSYCGTFDALADIDGKVHIIDFKTSSSIKDTFSVQLSAYASAYTYMGKLPKIEKRSILWIPKSGDQYEFKTFDTDLALDMNLFWSALQFAKYHNIWKEANKKV